jgi:hypothetical protein
VPYIFIHLAWGFHCKSLGTFKGFFIPVAWGFQYLLPGTFNGFFIYLAWGFHCKSIFGYYFQGPGCISKHEKCGYAKMKNSYKIAEKLEMVHTMYEGNLSGSMSGSFAYVFKRKSHLVGPQSEEKQDKNDYTC